MTVQTDPANPTPAAPAVPAQPTPKAKNTVGLIAMIVAIVSFIFAVIPATSFFAWIPAVVAIVLAIVGFTRKGQKKGTSIAAIIIAPAAWIIAIIVATAATVVGVADAIDKANDAPSSATVTEEEADAEAPAKEAAIGDTVTTEDGLDFVVTAMECGLAEAGEGFLAETAVGDFCKVSLTVANHGADATYFSVADVTGYIGEAAYDAHSSASSVNGQVLGASINPGLSATAELVFDVPDAAQLELVELSSNFGFDEAVVVRVS
ncbi:DUF4352 domain-containing protein [Diaminobutyricimonas sp. TR449]|uniref:DUF4352 domain-containing protein n=1 Tax=Diaminobutyricimonas sp. TR449 TaxID=2708076 RepID=UPI0014224044|nr:DUF4352 domain-containing protein [Diaminobutyricimonas sp. TR449]